MAVKRTRPIRPVGKIRKNAQKITAIKTNRKYVRTTRCSDEDRDKTNLTDEVWHTPTNSASRFFKVTVEMP